MEIRLRQSSTPPCFWSRQIWCQRRTFLPQANSLKAIPQFLQPLPACRISEPSYWIRERSIIDRLSWRSLMITHKLSTRRRPSLQLRGSMGALPSCRARRIHPRVGRWNPSMARRTYITTLRSTKKSKIKLSTKQHLQSSLENSLWSNETPTPPCNIRQLDPA